MTQSSAITLAIVIMIKNEEGSIEATLLPFVSAGIKHVFVFDTGSTDNTIQVVENFFKQHDVSGLIFQEPFIDFATSRNRALELAEQHFSHAIFFLMPDAEWHTHHVYKLIEFCEQQKNTNIELFSIKIKMNPLEFAMNRLFRASAKIRFKGVVHEVPAKIAGAYVPDPVYFEVKQTHKGFEKSRKRWEQDACLLLKAHEENPQDSRSAFYLAQTYDCLGELEKAFKYYQCREKLNGWDQENFINLYRLGFVAEKMSKQSNSMSWSVALDYYLKAFGFRPHRIEPLVKIANHYWPDNIPACYLFIRKAYDMPYTTDELFVDAEMYRYTRYEILSRCAWYVGEFELGERATLLALKVYPHMEHLKNNLKLYQEKCRSRMKTDTTTSLNAIKEYAVVKQPAS